MFNIESMFLTMCIRQGFKIMINLKTLIFKIKKTSNITSNIKD